MKDDIVKITHDSTRPAKKSASTELKESILYFVIIMVVYYLIMGIWNILVAPFRAIFETSRTKLERDIRIAKEKKARRDFQLFHLRGSTVDTLYNHILNPVERDENDLDTELTGVPNVYLKCYADQTHINMAFLDYFENQVELHLMSSWGRRHRFLRTIRDLYPEFTPKFSVIPSEIEAMREDAREGELVNELVDEIVKKGVSCSRAEEIVKDFGNDPEGFKKELAQAVKQSTGGTHE